MARRRASDSDLELYLIYRLRYRDFANLVVLGQRLASSPRVFPRFSRAEHQHIIATVSLASIGWLYSLVDHQRSALNVWPLWRRLFPHREAEIALVEAQMKPVMHELKRFRHNVAFHANQRLEDVVAAGRGLSPELAAASVAFLGLAESLIAEEPSVARLRSYLKANGIRCT